MKKKTVLMMMAALLLASAALVGSFSWQNVYAQGTTPGDESFVPGSIPGRLGFKAARGAMGPGDDSALAEVLGLSAEEMTSARAKAFELALEKALSEGLVTQNQADMLAKRSAGLGWGALSMLVGPDKAQLIDQDALFAEALGLSVDELSTAKQKVLQSKLDAAVSAGNLSQEAADAHLARQALASDPEFQAAMQEGLKAALQAAVEAGKLNQAQADAFLNQNRNSFGGLEAGFGRGNGLHGMMQGGMGGLGFGMQGQGQPGRGGPGKHSGFFGQPGMGFGPGNCDGSCLLQGQTD